MQHQIQILFSNFKAIYGNDPTSVYLLIIGVIALLSSLGAITFRLIYNKQKKVVIETSRRYNALLELNKKYNFYSLRPEYYVNFRVNTKAKFDRFNFDTNMKTKIVQSRDYYLMLLGQIYYNQDENCKYLKELMMLPGPTIETDTNLGIRRYQKLEDKLCCKKILNPVTEVIFCANVYYTSPKGRNSYHGRRVYFPNQIEQLLVAIKKEQNFKASKEYQRSLMTASMRYDILQRDSFRCVLCGRTANDGVQLHVDHIRPVSKGGKTEYSNLRTLCDQCNLGKSDKWNEYGVN